MKRNNTMKFNEFVNEGLGQKIKDAGVRLKSAINKMFAKVPKDLGDAFNEYVPPSGKADTVYGEMVRALNRVVYRWDNDGDKFMYGYGLQTAAPAASYLFEEFPYFRKSLSMYSVERVYTDPQASGSMAEDADSKYQEMMDGILSDFKAIPEAEAKKMIATKNSLDCVDYDISDTLIPELETAYSLEIESCINKDWVDLVDAYEDEDEAPSMYELVDHVMADCDCDSTMYRNLGVDTREVVEEILRNSGMLDEIKQMIKERDDDDDDDDDE